MAEITQVFHGMPVDPAVLELGGRGRKAKYPFATMEVGDFFHVLADETGKLPHNTIHGSRKYWEAKLLGRKFHIQTDSIGIRVHRIL